LRFWDPRRAAASRIVDDALDNYGPKRVRILADHFISAKPDEDVFSAEASVRLESMVEQETQQENDDDEQTRLLFTKLKKIRDSDKSMFSIVKYEISQYSSSSNTSISPSEKK
jgi:membrane-anchored protein YejM (alkaline phosphatase superfamily)